jgi:DNA-binding CsgD family transcriptional regulator
MQLMVPDRRGGQMSKYRSKLQVLPIVVALLLIITWLDVFGYTPTLFGQDSSFTNTSSIRWAFFGAAILSPAVIAFFPRRFAALDGSLALTLPLGLFTGSLMVVLSPSSVALPSALLAICGCLLATVCYMGIWLSLLKLICLRWDLFGIGVCFVVVYSVSNMVSGSVFLLLPLQSQTLALLLLAAGLTLSYPFCQKSLRESNEEEHGLNPDAHGLNPDTDIQSQSAAAPLLAWLLKYRMPLAQLFTLVLTSVILRGIGPSGLWGSAGARQPDDALGVLLTLAALMAVLIAVALPSFKRFATARGHFDRILPFFILVTLMFVLLVNRNLSLLPDFSPLLERYGHAFYPIVAAVAIRELRMPAYRVLGSVAASSFILGLFWMLFLEERLREVQIVILLLIYLSMIVMLLFSQDGDRTSATHPEGTPEKPSDSMSRGHLEAVASSYHLTARETEVFFLLARGRSSLHIQKALTLADGTVRTHVKNIYRKMGIHSRQQLMDIAESPETETWGNTAGGGGGRTETHSHYASHSTLSLSRAKREGLHCTWNDSKVCER